MRSPRHSFLLVALLGTAAAVPAFAQTAQPSAAMTVYPTCDRHPSADDSEAAHTAFLLGKRKYDEADYPSALVYFNDAYKTDCTKHELLPIISNAFERKGDKAEAVNALEVYLKRVPEAPDAEIQKKRIVNLKAQIADQQKAAMPTASAPPTVAPTASAAPTSTAAPPEKSQHGILPWVVVGTGGAMVVTGVVLLIVGAGQVSDVTKACPVPAGGTLGACGANSGFTPASAHDQDQQGKTLETVGGIVGGVGILAVAGGLFWHFSEKSPAAENAASVHFQPSFAPGYAGGSLGGRF